MTCYEVVFFIVHCLLHFFGYWVPCAVGAGVDLLLCRPCRTCEKKKHGFAYHPPREVRLIHHVTRTEAAVHVFGLMAACGSTLEDRQYRSATVPCKMENEPSLPRASPTAVKPNTHLSGLTSVQAEQHAQALSHSPLEPSTTRDADDTYNSHHYSHLSASSVAEIASPHLSTKPAATAAAATVKAPVAPAAKKALHKPTYASLDVATKKEIRRCRLTYDAPLYGPHIGTIMGAFRPLRPVAYIREEMRAWDGCYLAMDWYYADGEIPTAYDHDHTSRQRKAGLTAGCSGSGSDVARHEPFNRAAGDGAAASPAAVGNEKEKDQRGVMMQRTATKEPHQPPIQSLSDDSSHHAHRKSHVSRSNSPVQAGGVSPPPTSKAVGVVFIAPGLTSHGQTNYIQHLVHALHKADLHVCVLTTRGMGDTPPVTTPFLFNGAYTRDVRDCLQHFFTKEALTARFGRPLPLIGLGLSIGGIILSKYVGEEGVAGADPHLDAFICCCSPMDYVMTVEHMNRNGAQRAVYQHDMCNDIRTYLLRYEPLQHMPNVDNDWVFVQGNVHRFRRVVHFDEHVIAKSAGYRSAHHYHVDASAVTWLPYVPIPTLVISAADDPVIGRTVMPHRWREMTHSNPRLVYAEPPVGGHLGFLRDPWSELRDCDNWMEVFVRDRVLAACDYWRQVQRHAKEMHYDKPDPKATASTEAAPPHSPTLPAPLFSPTTTAAAAAAARPTLSSSTTLEAVLVPSLDLMKATAEANAALHVAGTETTASFSSADLAGGRDNTDNGSGRHRVDVREGQGREEMSVFVAETKTSPFNEAAVPAADAQQVDNNNESKHSSDTDRSVPPAGFDAPHEVSANTHTDAAAHPPKAALAAAAAAAAAAAVMPASPRPIQYLPPREDRPTNRCYFTYYCTPAVPEERLGQSYFTTSPAGAADDGAEEATDDNTSLATTTTGLDDGRSSMYATGSGAGGRRWNMSRGQDDGVAAAAGHALGKDPRCMMVTGQHTYASVVVNCDYTGDPRTMMLDD